jgi:hypothetical protein
VAIDNAKRGRLLEILTALKALKQGANVLFYKIVFRKKLSTHFSIAPHLLYYRLRRGVKRVLAAPLAGPIRLYLVRTVGSSAGQERAVVARRVR